MNHQYKNVMKEKIKEFMRLLRAYVLLRYDALRLKVAAKYADAMQAAHNKRYYVITDWRDKLQIVCNEDINLLKKRRYMTVTDADGKKKRKKFSYLPKDVTHLTVMRDCFYATKLSLNDTASYMSEEERERREKKWLNYMRRVRNGN